MSLYSELTDTRSPKLLQFWFLDDDGFLYDDNRGEPRLVGYELSSRSRNGNIIPIALFTPEEPDKMTYEDIREGFDPKEVIIDYSVINREKGISGVAELIPF